VGKEISYCQVCGRRLGVGEALENQVYVHEGRRYCSACRPERATTKVPLPERRTSSTKMRSQPTAARVKETTRVGKRNGPALAIAAGLAVASAIGIAIAAGSRAPEPPAAFPKTPGEAAAPASTPAPKPGAGLTLDEMLSRVRELQQSDLMFERRDEVRRLLADAAVKAGSRVEEVDLLSAGYDRRFEEAAARLADFTRSEAARMATKQKFAEAIERLDGFPAAFRTSRAAGTLQRLREDYERRRSAPVAPPASADTSPRRVL